MRDVLGGGAAAAKARVSLTEVLATPHTYGVGALPGLAGEITIMDGRTWVARPDGADLRVEGPTSSTAESAAILTIASVDRWDTIPIDQDLQGDALEAFIATQARARGLNTKRPFPFLIEGSLTDLQVHVINGACPMRPGVRLAADEQPWRYQLEMPHDATIVGVYAADSVGSITHPGTCIHAHALFDVNGKTVTGHAERIAVARGATLRLPAGKSR